MIDAAWTYMDEGMNAPPEDSETGYSVPVVGWWTDTPDKLESGYYELQVACLDDDGRAGGWLGYCADGNYCLVDPDRLGNPAAWISRPMDTAERDRERAARRG